MILTQNIAAKKLKRMALQIAERNTSVQSIIIIGIEENGMFIAKEIAKQLTALFGGEMQCIGLRINKKNPNEITLSENVTLTNKAVLLVDDVCNSGKTLLYALAPLLAQHPSQIETLALVERTYKLFPVALNYVGVSVATKAEEHIEVIVEGGEIIGAKFKEAGPLNPPKGDFSLK
jgi:pyrimidine operon attenuation protein / uracil phosphoribosyltransferase